MSDCTCNVYAADGSGRVWHGARGTALFTDPTHRRKRRRSAAQEVPMSEGRSERGLPTEQVLMGRDHDDFFPWTWQRWVDGNGGYLDEGSISTPNGRRPDGSMHTYWQVAAPVHEFVGPYICAVVNAYEGKGWRARLARWLLRPAAHPGSNKQGEVEQ